MTSKTLILITGANQGLGYYTAQQLAAEGTYHVLIGSRDINKAKTAIESLANDTSVKVDANDLEPLQIDINDDASISAAAETVEKKYGKLDILLNNAAVALPGEDEVLKSGDSSLRDFFRQHYETNVFGTVAAAEAFIPLLMKGEKKRLAFTSSSMGSLHEATEGNLIPGVSLAPSCCLCSTTGTFD
jgi:NAD(P)-dependent dehydrogenase (short-subunit alcohol dehydrogenase family)